MLDQLSQILKIHQKNLADGQLFLACSGGRDSLALAWACKLLYEQGKLPMLPTLLHVHHGWQSVNDDWAKLVQNWAGEQGFICQILPVSLQKNSETAARIARYDAFMNVMNDGDVLLVAHHANDQAETMLMRLINGAGVQGLSAIKVWQQKCCKDKIIRLFRPMLTITRDEISQFARQHHLPYVDDLTNLDDKYVRGRLRNHVMPTLKQINPKAIQNIARTGELLAQSAQIVDWVVGEKMAWVVSATFSQPPFCEVLDIDKLTTVPHLLQSALIHAWLTQDEPLPPSHRLVQDVLHLVHRTSNDHQTQLFWQGENGYVIGRYGKYIYRYRDDAWACLLAENQGDDAIDFEVCGGIFTLKNCKNCMIYWQIPDDLIGRFITIKSVTRQMVVPFFHKHLHGKKLMQTLGIPVWLRDNLWLVCCEDRPVLLLTVGRAWRLDNKDVMIKGAYFA